MNIKLILPIIMILLLTGLVSAEVTHTLEITNIDTQGDLTINNEVSIIVSVKNTGEEPFLLPDEGDLQIDFGDNTHSDLIQMPELVSEETEKFTFTHKYTEVKEYNINAEVEFSDYDQTHKNSAEKTITVNGVSNQEPADFTWNSSELFPGNEVTFTSTNENALRYDWIVDNKILYYGNPLKYTFQEEGTHTINLTVHYDTNTHDNVVKQVIVSKDNEDNSSEDNVTTTENGSIILSATELNFGSDSQDRGETTTATLTLTNTGTKALTGLKLTALDNADKLLDSKYNFNVNALETYTIESGEIKTITINLDVPADKDSVKEQIGKLEIQGTVEGKTISTSLPMYMEAKSYLQIDKVRVEVQNRDIGYEKISNGENYDKLEEGDEILVTVTLENLYSRSDNIKINDAYVKIKADKNDWDINDESNDVDIREDDKETFEMTFNLDDLNNDKTDVTIQAYGTDENGNFEHYDELTFELELDNSNNGDIKINDITWKDSSINCKDNYAELEIELKNKGNSNERNAAIRVEINDNGFDYDEKEDNIRVNKYDRETISFRIPLDNDMDSGNYDVSITSYYDNTRKSDTDTTTMRISCSGSSGTTTTSTSTTKTTTTTSSNNANTGNIVTTTTPSANTITNEEIPKKAGLFDDLGNDDMYLLALAVIIIVLFTGAVILLFVILKNK